MFVNHSYPYYVFAYRDAKTGAFYRSDKYNNKVHFLELEEIIDKQLNDLTDIFISKWCINDKWERIVAPYFDIDGQDLEIVYNVALKIYYYLLDMFKSKDIISVVFSGAKGFHIELSERRLAVDRGYYEDLKGFTRWFAKKVEKELKIESYIDFRVYEPKRLWRLEKSINSKTGLFCHKLPIEEVFKKGLDKIKEYCKYQRNYKLYTDPEQKAYYYAKAKFNELFIEYNNLKKKKIEEVNNINKLNLQKDELPPCIIYLLENDVPEGYRNTALYVLARALNKVYGLNTETIYDYLAGWCLSIGMVESEIYPTIDSACHSEMKFSCYNSSYLNSLLENGVTKCPYVGKTFRETKILKTTLCPVYRTLKSVNKVEKIVNKYDKHLSELYSSLKRAFKQKDWLRAREITSTIYTIKSKIVKEVEDEHAISE